MVHVLQAIPEFPLAFRSMMSVGVEALNVLVVEGRFQCVCVKMDTRTLALTSLIGSHHFVRSCYQRP